MAVNVTYLLGAGASYEALPLVKDIKDDAGKIIKAGIGHDIKNIANIFNSSNPGDFKKIVSDLNSLGDKTLEYSSPNISIRR